MFSTFNLQLNMKPVKTLSQLADKLQSDGTLRRVAVVCPADDHTGYVVRRALTEGLADFILVADKGRTDIALQIQETSPEHVQVCFTETPDEACALGVKLVRNGDADVLMKGLVSTDILLRAVLNKQSGLLPQGGVLSHLAVAEMPLYHKLLYMSDVAVIPRPMLDQYRSIIKADLAVADKLGCSQPRIALIHCVEKVSDKFPHTLSYRQLKQDAAEGMFGDVLIDGPMDMKTACDPHSGEVKGISSTVAGDADLVIFPNIEAGNVFYKTITLFSQAVTAAMLTGTIAPVVVPSRADSGQSKYFSLCLALNSL